MSFIKHSCRIRRRYQWPLSPLNGIGCGSRIAVAVGGHRPGNWQQDMRTRSFSYLERAGLLALNRCHGKVIFSLLNHERGQVYGTAASGAQLC